MTETPSSQPPRPPEGEQPVTPPPPAEKPNEITWATVCHLSALGMLLGVPFGHILGPLVVWLIKRHEMPMVDACGKEALNFQITMSIAAAVSVALIPLLVGLLLLPAVIIFDIVFVIIAAIKASEGTPYRYPVCIRFIK